MLRADWATNMIQEVCVMIISVTILRLGLRSHGADAVVITLMDRHITTSEWIDCMVMNVTISSIRFLGRERYSDRFLTEERRRRLVRLALCSSCRHDLSLLLWLVTRSHGIRSHVVPCMIFILLVGSCKHWRNKGWVNYPFALFA